MYAAFLLTWATALPQCLHLSSSEKGLISKNIGNAAQQHSDACMRTNVRLRRCMFVEEDDAACSVAMCFGIQEVTVFV